VDRLHPSKNSGRYFILNELRKAYSSAINKYLDKSKPYRLLDYGCGEMPYKPLFGINVEYIGYDFVDNQKASKFLNLQNTTEEDNLSVDLVISSQVLEHVENTSVYLEEIHRVLKNEGLLLLSTHGYWMYHPTPQDLWRWTREGLNRILFDSSFEVLEIFCIGDLTTSGLQLFQDGLRIRIHRYLRKSFFYIIQFLQYHLYTEKSNMDACVYLIVAKKKQDE
jgi:SAM-dependent methyltransferase